MNHLTRLAAAIRLQGPGVVYTSHEAAALLHTTRSMAATYLRRAERQGWLQAQTPSAHGGGHRRVRHSVVVRYVATETPPPADALCPRCLSAPPRQPATYGGRVSLCVACAQAAARHKYQGRVGRHVADDIPPAEIERRFQYHLQQIRRRTWTSVQP